MIEKIFKDHLKWINTVKKMGASQEEAEDIVGDMYLIISRMLNNGLNIEYGNQVNYYYIYKTLRTSFLKLQNLKTKQNNISLDYLRDEIDFNLECDSYVDFNEAKDLIDEKLDNLEWYDRTIYKVIESGVSFTKLSKQTKISYHPIYNTYRKVKDKLKDKLDL